MESEELETIISVPLFWGNLSIIYDILFSILLAIVVVKNLLDRDFMTVIQTFVTLDGSSIMHYTWGYTRRILRTFS